MAAEIGGRAVEADVSDAGQAAALVEGVAELDVLVNNAGITRDGLIARMSDEDEVRSYRRWRGGKGGS